MFTVDTKMYAYSVMVSTSQAQKSKRDVYGVEVQSSVDK